jgi:hypothetical protein
MDSLDGCRRSGAASLQHILKLLLPFLAAMRKSSLVSGILEGERHVVDSFFESSRDWRNLVHGSNEILPFDLKSHIEDLVREILSCVKASILTDWSM